MKVKKDLFGLIAVVILGLILVFAMRIKNSPVKNKIYMAGKELYVEIADTEESRESGLMYRNFLPENQGMLFVFDSEDYHAFWMRNTYIPLDIIWIDQNSKIVDIKTDFKPCTMPNCEAYKPIKKAMYVVEVNTGWTEKNNVKVGDSVSLK